MKRLNIILAIMLLLSVLLTSCGVYTPAVNDGDGTNTGTEGDTSGKPDDGNGNGDGGGESDTDEELPYTVTLNVNGKAYTPNANGGPYFVQWSDDFSIHTAELIDGRAEIYGLDKDYRVTLLNVPSGYAYNPNAYVATADSRDVSIELIKPQRTDGSGSGEYNRIELRKTGVYQVTISTPQQLVYFHFLPPEYGNYTIESWADVTENNVNPRMDLYYGTNAGAIYFDRTINDGGVSSTYTKNFKYVQTIYPDEISSTGGASVIPFAVGATAKNGSYPIKLTFSIHKDGEEDRDKQNVEMMIPTERLEKTKNYSSLLYTLTGPEINEGGNNVFHGEMFRLWAKGTGMPMISLTGERDNTIAGRLSGSYSVTFINPRTGREIVRTIEFNPTDELSGWVKITEEDKKAGTTVVGSYTYSVCKEHDFDNLSDKYCNLCGYAAAEKQAETAPSVSLIFQSGERIDYAGFTFDKDGELYYGVGDNFYHFYDEENGTWGEILYAYVSAPCRFIDLAFTQIEYQGNKNLTVNGGTQNYKYFIEGTRVFSMGYFCVNFPDNNAICPCLESGDCVGACLIGCLNCHDQCNQVTEEVLNAPGGYANYTNQDGVYAVTEELRDFLQKYSTAQLLFRDGNGHVETNPTVKVYSNEDDQWLFACAYYEKN